MALTGTKTFLNYIGGDWVDSASGETFESFNPASGDTIGTFPRSTPEAAQPVRLAERGHELGDLEGGYQRWNARIEPDGRLVPEISPV